MEVTATTTTKNKQTNRAVDSSIPFAPYSFRHSLIDRINFYTKNVFDCRRQFIRLLFVFSGKKTHTMRPRIWNRLGKRTQAPKKH
jgi:hypothetical protein